MKSKRLKFLAVCILTTIASCGRSNKADKGEPNPNSGKNQVGLLAELLKKQTFADRVLVPPDQTPDGVEAYFEPKSLSDILELTESEFEREIAPFAEVDDSFKREVVRFISDGVWASSPYRFKGPVDNETSDPLDIHQDCNGLKTENTSKAGRGFFNYVAVNDTTCQFEELSPQTYHVRRAQWALRSFKSEGCDFSPLTGKLLTTKLLPDTTDCLLKNGTYNVKILHKLGVQAASATKENKQYYDEKSFINYLGTSSGEHCVVKRRDEETITLSECRYASVAVGQMFSNIGVVSVEQRYNAFSLMTMRNVVFEVDSRGLSRTFAGDFDVEHRGWTGTVSLSGENLELVGTLTNPEGNSITINDRISNRLPNFW